MNARDDVLTFDLFNPPPVFPTVRRDDQPTSIAAAAKALTNASRGRYLALSGLATGPATDFELADRTGWQQTSIGKRRGECVALGWVTGTVDRFGKRLTRPSPSGSPSLVWELTQAGREKLAELRAQK